MAPRPARLKQTLTLWQVVVMGLAYMTPMVVFDTFGIVTDITQGHVTTAYLLALVGSFMVMGGVLFRLERRGYLRAVFLVSIGLLLLVLNATQSSGPA